VGRDGTLTTWFRPALPPLARPACARRRISVTPGPVAVARVTEIIASSPDGFREAVEEGVARAAQTLRNLTGLEVLGKRVKVERGLITEYRVDMKITFLLE
jgi:flavin-binding protein dodecin